MSLPADLPVLDVTSPGFLADPCDSVSFEQFPGGIGRSARGLELLAYDAVGEALRAPQLRNATSAKMRALGLTEGPVYNALTSMLTSTEGADHRRMRRAVAPWFTNTTVERLRADVRARIDAWARQQSGSGVDFANEIGINLPASVFCKVVGADPEEIPFIAQASIDILALALFDPAMRDRVEKSTLAALEWVRELIERKRREPADDVISALLASVDDGTITLQDVIDVVVTLLIASVDSTRGQMGCDLSALARNPGQWQVLREHPEAVPDAVSELVRYAPAVLTLGRTATEDFELRGVPLRPGEPVFLDAFAANNDPAVYERPRELDVLATRERIPFTFGNGRHSCLGRMIATLEQEELLRSLLTHWKEFSVEEESFTGSPYTFSTAKLRLSVTAV